MNKTTVLLDTNHLYKNISNYDKNRIGYICTFLNIFDFLSSDRIVIDGPINEVKIERWRKAIINGINHSELIHFSHWHYIALCQFNFERTVNYELNLEFSAISLTEKIVNNKFDIESDRDEFIYIVERFKKAKLEYAEQIEQVIKNGYRFLKENECFIFDNRNKLLDINHTGINSIIEICKQMLIENLKIFSKKVCNDSYKFDISNFNWNLVEIWLKVFSSYIKDKIINRNYNIAPNDYVDYFNLLYLEDGMLYATDEVSIIENFKRSSLEHRLYQI